MYFLRVASEIKNIFLTRLHKSQHSNIHTYSAYLSAYPDIRPLNAILYSDKSNNIIDCQALLCFNSIRDRFVTNFHNIWKKNFDYVQSKKI